MRKVIVTGMKSSQWKEKPERNKARKLHFKVNK